MSDTPPDETIPDPLAEPSDGEATDPAELEDAPPDDGDET